MADSTNSKLVIINTWGKFIFFKKDVSGKYEASFIALPL